MRTESTLLAWSDVSPADDGTTIADLFRVLRRRRRTIVLVTVLLTGATAAFASQLDARYSRSEEHTSELQSLMRNSYAVFCLKNKKSLNTITHNETTVFS